MTEIPIILCFDERILMGAGVTIQSMLDSAAPGTSYQIHVFHPGLSDVAMRGLSSLVDGGRHSLRYHKIEAERFAGMPKSNGSWTEIVYYRLLASEVLPEVERAIYSDVDVFFAKDMTQVFLTDLTGYSWAGVAAEANNSETVMHRYFPENEREIIFFSGFMVMNLEQMRLENAVERYFEVIEEVGDRLKFFDLDVLNIASKKIRRIPFEYVTLEDIFEAEDVTTSRDYEYLKSVYEIDELTAARDRPAIIHYAGRRGKPWQRRDMPSYYQEVVARLPRALQSRTFRDWRRRWLSAKGYRRLPTRKR